MAPVIRGNSIYTIVNGPSWTQAEANSVKLGGHLVTIEDGNENQWIVDTFRSIEGAPNIDTVAPNQGHWNSVYYIGINDKIVDGRFEWISGSFVSYTNWGDDGDYYWADPGFDNRDIGAISLYDGFARWMGPGKWGMNPESECANRSGIDEIQGIAEIPFIQRGDSAYVIVEGPTWEEAEANAQALGGHLVTINDAEENEWIKQNLGIGKWIGINDKDSEGNFNWSSGEPVVFTDWGAGEPNNADGRDGSTQHYGWMQTQNDYGKWDDAQNGVGIVLGIAEIKLSDLGVANSGGGGGGSAGGGGVTLPTLQTTTATSNQLILTFSEDIQIAGGGALNPAYMTVTVDEQTRKITRSQITAPDHPTIHTASQLALTLSGRSLDRASSIIISYNPPSNGSNQGFITDLSDNPLAPIASQAVDTYSSSTNISKSGIASAYKNLILTGTAPITGYGNTQDNTITGNDANNILDGLAGADTMIGGLGDDTYVVDNISDLITELASAGTDTVQSSIAYTLADDLENLTLLGSAAINGTGNSANNVLTGNTGANVLNGNGGTDTLIGGRGSDTYIVDSTDDSIIETGTSSDVDSVQASVSWSLGSNLENLTLTGTSTIDGSGNERNNTISGNDAANILDGGNGGTDRLTGLAGADTFRLSTRPSSFRNTTADQITDFSSAQGDKIQITKSAFSITASTATLSVVSNAAALNTALSGSAQFIYNTANGELHWNQNGITRGAGTGGVLAILDNKAALGSGDLILI
jgi:Ca2+-binding RTX toxin-like protein